MNIDPKKYYRHKENGIIHKGDEWPTFWLFFGNDVSKLEEVTVTPVKPEPEPKPEPRRGKPGEVWRLKHGPVCLLAEHGSITLRSDYGGAFDGIGLGAHAFEEAVGHKCIAETLEEWARKEWGLSDTEKDKPETVTVTRRTEVEGTCDYLVAVNKALHEEIKEHRRHVSKLMKRERHWKTLIDIFERDYVSKSDVVEALRMTEGWSKSALSGKREFLPIYKARKALEKLGITPAK